MKTLQNFFSRTTLVVGLICWLCFFLPNVKAQQGTWTHPVYDERPLSLQVDTTKTSKGKLAMGTTFLPMQTTAVHFGQSQTAEFTITWKDNKLEVLYGKETKPSEAVKQFFNWLKEYSEQTYYILKKDDYEFTNGFGYEMYFRVKGKK